PFGSVPVRIAGSSGSGRDRSAPGSCAAASPATSRQAMRTPDGIRYPATMRLKIKRLDVTVPLPAYGTPEAAGFDLAPARDLTVAPRSIALVRTGLVIGVPPGYFLAIFARSSVPLKRGLILPNGVGVVDPDYCGPEDEVMIQVLNVTDLHVTVSRGDRIAQGIVLPAPRVDWEEVDEIREVTRGGFGATGT